MLGRNAEKSHRNRANGLVSSRKYRVPSHPMPSKGVPSGKGIPLEGVGIIHSFIINYSFQRLPFPFLLPTKASIMKFYFFAVVFISIIFFSCLQPPDYPIEPVIEYIGLSKNSIQQGNDASKEDELVIALSFTDGDGDLSNDENLIDVMLIDSRDGQKTPFSLPTIPEQGTGNGISGEIRLKVSNTPFNMCCIYDDKNGQDPCTDSNLFPTDTFYYSISIIDRAGNESNKIDTEPIILLCN